MDCLRSAAARVRRTRTRTRIVSPDVCTSLNVITLPATRERAAATAAGAARVRTLISARPAATRVTSAADTAPIPRRLLTSSGIAAGSTTSASTVTARRSPAAPAPADDGSTPASRPARSAPSCVRHCAAPSAAFSASTKTRAVAARSAIVLPAGAATRRTFARHDTATRPVPRTSPSGTTSEVTSAACSSDARAAAWAAAPALVSPGSPARARTPADDSAVTRPADEGSARLALVGRGDQHPGRRPIFAGVTGGGGDGDAPVRSCGAARSRRPRPRAGSCTRRSPRLPPASR